MDESVIEIRGRQQIAPARSCVDPPLRRTVYECASLSCCNVRIVEVLEFDERPIANAQKALLNTVCAVAALL